MRIRASALSAAMVAVIGASASAQTLSLGEVARQAEAAKATSKKATKTYTNADLSDVPATAHAPSPPSSGFVSKTLDQPASAEEVIARSQEKVEQDSLAKESEPRWRKRAESIRMEMVRVETRLLLLNRPSDARSSNPAAQARHDNEIVKYQQSRDVLKNNWAKLEDAARAAKIPTEWLDPRPAR